MPRILVTRAPHQASALADALRARGFEPVLIPTIELAPPASFCALDAALDCLSDFHWLLFTSANAVEAFAQRLRALKGKGFSPSATARSQHEALSTSYFLLPTSCLIAAIGPATAQAIEKLLGTKPSLLPEKAIAESLAKALIPHAKQPDGTPTRFLLARAETARDILPEILTAAGAQVTIVPVYRTLIPVSSIDQIRTLFGSLETYPDAITFTSSSTATNLLALLEAAGLSLPNHIPRLSIGPITSQTLREAGLPPHAEARIATVESLVEIVSRIIA